MKGLLKGLLALSGFAAEAAAQEVVWRPTGAAARLGHPAAVSSPAPASLLRPAVYQDDAGFSFRLTRADDPKAKDAKADKKEGWTAPPPAPVARPLPDCGPGVWGAFAADPYCNPIPCEGLPDLEHPASPPIDGGVKLASTCGFCTWSVYARPEYLLWRIKDSRYPVLLTTGTEASQGILGSPGTTVLFGGNDDVSNGTRSGGRFTAGIWCDCEETLGLETSYFVLGERSVNFMAGSAAFPVVARPFVPLNPGVAPRELAIFPNKSEGKVTIETPSNLWGAELNGRYRYCCDCLGRLDFLGGVRYLELSEGLFITETLRRTVVAPGSNPFPPFGTQSLVSDRFATQNKFWGGQVGVLGELRRGPWSLDLQAKLALGNTHQVVTIDGGQLVVPPPTTPPTPVSTAVGGLLALPSNIGRFTRDRFSVVPEVGATVRFQITDWCRLNAGYNFLYWSRVVRPGDQVDLVLDANQIPNFLATPAPAASQTRPRPTLRETDFWAHGFSFGVELRW